jgi:tRNA-splicing ligase RtcB
MPYKEVQIGGLGVPVLSWTGHEFSWEEQNMLRNVSKLPCVYKHVSLMADGHLGSGSMVGSVIATKDAVIPATVGVDIGCGMMAVKTQFKSGKLDRKLPKLFEQIEKNIPVGFNEYGMDDTETRNWSGFDRFNQLHEGVQDRKAKAMNQLGTLGGGNHFIEVCLDLEDSVWLMLHSGSRNIGKEIADRHIHTAKGLWKLSELPDAALAYFIKGTPEFDAYWRDLKWAQEYAMANRETMMARLKKVFGKVVGEIKPELFVNCHHNYVAEEVHYGESVYVTRKGAVRASEDDLGIIPGAMGAKSFIVRGKGNPESFNSCSHGAGRKMSRGEAKRRYKREDLIESTKGLVCRKDTGVIDEIKHSYKNIEKVMAQQTDLVEVVAELRSVLCVKG